MYLKRLEIQGFKSFAKKTVLEFESGITAVVGPNGSGKSNVADCLRWVLGEQSTKLLRGKKSDDVIFAGSDKKLRLGFAEVIATFDNRDHRIPIDASEVSIGRRIDRSGESEYLLNGAKVRLLDIIDLETKSNIGTSHYTVIGQGTIDQMILAGPTEIKNLIDEASGVRNYYLKREKTLRRLEQTAANLMRAEDLAAELEPRLKSLRRQAKRMEARSQIEAELLIYQREFFGKQYRELSKVLDRLAGQLEIVSGKRLVVETDLETRRKTLETSMKTQLKDTGKETEALQGLQRQRQSILEELGMIRGTMQSRKTANPTDPETLRIQLHDIKNQLTERKLHIGQLVVDIEDRNRVTTDMEQAISETEKELAKLYQQLAHPSEAGWKNLVNDLDRLKNRFGKLYETVFAQSATIEQIRSHAKQFREDLEDMSVKSFAMLTEPVGDARNLQESLQKLMHDKDRLTESLTRHKLELSKLELEQQFVREEETKLQSEVVRLELLLKEADSASADAFLQDLMFRQQQLQKHLEKLDQEIHALSQKQNADTAAQTAWKEQFLAEEKFIRQKQDELHRLQEEEKNFQIEQAKQLTLQETLVVEIRQALGPQGLETIETQDMPIITSGLEEKIAKLRHQLEMIGGVDDLTIQEYQETETRFQNLTTQVADLKKGMQDLRQIIDELDSHIKVKFNEAFHAINAKFEHYFRLLFNGGQAHLTLLRSSEELAESMQEEEEDSQDQQRPEERIISKYQHGNTNIVGVDIKATPAGKKLSNIQALSGGERALTSIALLCSLLSCFPSPFVVLDEVDAALDEANTIRFGQILGSLSHQTQFITITHNRETMAQANTLYGVTMGDDGISKLLGIKLAQAQVYAK